MRKNKPHKLTQSESKRKSFYEKHFGKPRNEWVAKNGSILGSLKPRNLIEISDSRGYKSWLQIAKKNSHKNVICHEFPCDSILEDQINWVKNGYELYSISTKPRASWGSKSGRKNNLADLAQWVKGRHSELKHDPSFKTAEARYIKIQQELKLKKFGKLLCIEYSIETIKRFIYS